MNEKKHRATSKKRQTHKTAKKQTKNEEPWNKMKRSKNKHHTDKQRPNNIEKQKKQLHENDS